MEAAARGGATRTPLCAEESAARGEPLAATASRVDHWLVVEYRRLWSRDVLAGSGLTDEVKRHLRAQLEALPRSRLLFVRRPDRRDREGLAVFFGRSGEHGGRFHALELGDHEELLDVDAAAVLRDDSPAPPALERPLLVVCTHGKRDRCCARYGRPLYDALRGRGDVRESVWQSTHVGGDRFAGNLVCLPEGLYFGRLGGEEGGAVVDAYLEGRIALGPYRGRSCYPFPAQAAERSVREETGARGVGDLALTGIERAGEDAWLVRFHVRPTGETHEVEVVAERASEPAFLTCSSAAPSRPRRFVAAGRRVLAGP